MLKLQWVSCDVLHRPMLEDSRVRWRNMKNSGIVVSPIVQYLHILPQQFLLGPLQDLHEQAATVNQNASNTVGWIIRRADIKMSCTCSSDTVGEALLI